METLIYCNQIYQRMSWAHLLLDLSIGCLHDYLLPCSSGGSGVLLHGLLPTRSSLETKGEQYELMLDGWLLYYYYWLRLRRLSSKKQNKKRKHCGLSKNHCFLLNVNGSSTLLKWGLLAALNMKTYYTMP